MANGEDNNDLPGGGTATAETQPVSVAFDVPLIPQPTKVSCWAAALAMVISYRDQASHTVDEVANLGGLSLVTGYGWSAISDAVSAWQLNQEGSACGPP